MSTIIMYFCPKTTTDAFHVGLGEKGAYVSSLDYLRINVNIQSTTQIYLLLMHDYKSPATPHISSCRP